MAGVDHKARAPIGDDDQSGLHTVGLEPEDQDEDRGQPITTEGGTTMGNFLFSTANIQRN